MAGSNRPTPAQIAKWKKAMLDAGEPEMAGLLSKKEKQMTDALKVKRKRGLACRIHGSNSVLDLDRVRELMEKGQ